MKGLTLSTEQVVNEILISVTALWMLQQSIFLMKERNPIRRISHVSVKILKNFHTYYCNEESYIGSTKLHTSCMCIYPKVPNVGSGRNILSRWWELTMWQTWWDMRQFNNLISRWALGTVITHYSHVHEVTRGSLIGC